MTQSTSTNGNGRKSNAPAFIAYHVADQGRGRKFWTRLGGVWEHKKGEGLTVFLNVVPIDFDGRIVLLPPKADDTDNEAAGDDAAPGNEEVDDEIPF